MKLNFKYHNQLVELWANDGINVQLEQEKIITNNETRFRDEVTGLQKELENAIVRGKNWFLYLVNELISLFLLLISFGFFAIKVCQAFA